MGWWRYGWGAYRVGKWGWKALRGWGGWGGLAGLGGWGGLGLGGLGGWGGLGTLGGLGVGAYPLLIPAMFYLLNTPHWDHGIVPSLCLRILAVKARLLAGPAIGIGAFVIGTGSGLLIGKLLGIRMVLRLLQPKHKHYHPYVQKGWKRFRPPGWKPFRLRLRLPFFRRFRFHPRFPPPPHFNFHSYPPIKNIHYSSKPYGTYEHAPEIQHGWATSTRHNPSHSHSEETSGWLPGKGPNLGGSSTYEGSSSHLYNPHEETSSSYKTGSDEHSSYGAGRYAEQDTSYSEASQRYKKSSTFIKDFIRSEVMKMKSDKYNGTTSKEEEEILNEMFNEQFAKDITDAVQEDSVPEFVAMPNETFDPLSLNATSIGESTSDNATTQAIKSSESKVNESLTDSSIFSSVMKTLQDYSPLNFVPDALVSWLTNGSDAKDESDTKKEKRETDSNEVNVQHMTKLIVKDIKNLFSVISFLDIGRCLEKMVCEIHSRGRKYTERQIANSYEGNIITAFRIMESIMPDDKDASVTKYREASRLGKKHETPEICAKNFPGCPVSTNQLIRLGSLISDSTTDAEPSD